VVERAVEVDDGVEVLLAPPELRETRGKSLRRGDGQVLDSSRRGRAKRVGAEKATRLSRTSASTFSFLVSLSLFRAHEYIFSGPTLVTHCHWERTITFAPLGSRLLLTSSVIPFRSRMPCAAWATTSLTAWEAAWYVLSTV